jgi:hypothetical protein
MNLKVKKTSQQLEKSEGTYTDNSLIELFILNLSLFSLYKPLSNTKTQHAAAACVGC